MNVTFTCTSRLRSYELYVLLVIFRISICLFKYIVTKLLTKKTDRLQATTFECKTKIISGKYCICVFFRRIFSVIIEIRSQSLLISAVNFFAWYKHIISSSLYDFLSLQHFQLIFDKWKFISPNVALNCAFTLWTPHDKITLKFNLILNCIRIEKMEEKKTCTAPVRTCLLVHRSYLPCGSDRSIKITN